MARVSRDSEGGGDSDLESLIVKHYNSVESPRGVVGGETRVSGAHPEEGGRSCRRTGHEARGRSI